jgi:CO/xanthine dehydrogenase FAD-binding subunit
MLVKGADSALVGKQIDERVAVLVGELAAKMAKPLTTSGLTPEYRREIVKVYAKRAVMACGNS